MVERVLSIRNSRTNALAAALVFVAGAYLIWKISESPDQAVQFAFNGISVGAIYALLAMGFTIVYSTVWFFDLYYGAAAAIGAYGVFYLRSKEAAGALYGGVNSPYVNAMFAAVVAGVVAWALHAAYFNRLRARFGARTVIAAEAAVAGGAGAYAGLVMTYTEHMHVMLSPAVGIAAAGTVIWAARAGFGRAGAAVAALPALALGGYCAMLIAGAPGSKLYLSWAVSCLLAGAVGLAFYRGLYIYVRRRARSPQIMLVASLGILLALTAATAIVFDTAARPLPDAFGSEPWTILGGKIKGFNIFTLGVAIVGFIGMLYLLKKTSFGRAVRAIGDDEEVSKVVGINTTVVIAIVFFIGAFYAAAAGVLSGHDTAIQPRMGLLLLLKGWIASVVGGIGNLYGALVGGFALGMIEQFGIWDLAGEWKDVISFLALILFLSFWPKGLLPRK